MSRLSLGHKITAHIHLIAILVFTVFVVAEQVGVVHALLRLTQQLFHWINVFLVAQILAAVTVTIRVEVFAVLNGELETCPHYIRPLACQIERYSNVSIF